MISHSWDCDDLESGDLGRQSQGLGELGLSAVSSDGLNCDRHPNDNSNIIDTANGKSFQLDDLNGMHQKCIRKPPPEKRLLSAAIKRKMQNILSIITVSY